MISTALEFDGTDIATVLKSANTTTPPQQKFTPTKTYRAPTFHTNVPTQTTPWKPRPGPPDTQSSGRPMATPAGSSSNSSQKGRRHLSNHEIAERKRQGLCFRCDERYSPTHRNECKFKDLRVLTVLNGLKVEICEETTPDHIEEEEPPPEYMSLSLGAFVGKNTLTATKMWGTIGRLKVVIMLDSGATHNFIAPSVVKQAKLKPFKDFCNDIALGTGVLVKSMGLCKDVSFQVAELEFTADFIALELGSADVILGIQWLRTLGTCQIDWVAHELNLLSKCSSRRSSTMRFPLGS